MAGRHTLKYPSIQTMLLIADATPLPPRCLRLRRQCSEGARKSRNSASCVRKAVAEGIDDSVKLLTGWRNFQPMLEIEGDKMAYKVIFALISIFVVSSCGGNAVTTNGEAVGGPGVIVNRYDDRNGNTTGTIEDGNPDDLLNLDGYFYRTRATPQQSVFQAAVTTQCLAPPYGSCFLQVPVPVGSSCYCVFPNGAYANGYAN